jgi:hypothetical protein
MPIIPKIEAFSDFVDKQFPKFENLNNNPFPSDLSQDFISAV